MLVHAEPHTHISSDQLLNMDNKYMTQQQKANLKMLEKIQSSASIIIAGLKHSCLNSISLYESNLKLLIPRSEENGVKYFNKP